MSYAPTTRHAPRSASPRLAAQAPRGEGHGGRGRVTGGAEERDLLAARDGVHRVDGRDACPTPAPTREAVRGVRGQPIRGVVRGGGGNAARGLVGEAGLAQRGTQAAAGAAGRADEEEGRVPVWIISWG